MAAADVRPDRVTLWVWVLAFGLLWLDLLRQLSFTWATSEQYEYGWFVPLLAAGLLLRNWGTRPDPVPGRDPWALKIGMGVLVLALLPIRIVAEVNRTWPLMNWLTAVLTVVLTLYAIHRVGGWAWVRHFAFPIAFILTAVRWPFRIEHGLTQGLMHIVAAISVEILGLFNIPALQRGNLIEIGSGVVGVDEACSGIRSFQTTLMIGLFLGEHFRLLWSRRILLVLGGLLFAFALNVGRALFLTWQASAQGVEAIDKYHDGAGWSIVIGCFIGLWLMAGRLAKAPPIEPKASCPPVGGLRRAPAIGFAIWMVLIFLGNEVWYRSRDTSWKESTRWAFQAPQDAPGYGPVEVGDSILRQLKYDHGTAGAWRTLDGRAWTAFFFRWDPRTAGHSSLGRVHRPDRCLPGSGFRIVEDAGVEGFEADGVTIPFRRYTFGRDEAVLHVFFCLWEDGMDRQGGLGSKYGERFRLAIQGRRLIGQQTFQLILAGYPSLAEATESVRRELPGLVEVQRPDVVP